MTRIEEEIDAIINLVASDRLAGAAVGVMRNGDVIASFSRGLSNRSRNTPITPDSAFRICSITKQFTCTLLLIAESRGLVALEDHPGRYVEIAKGFHPSTTIRHLATNQSGLKDYWCVAMLLGARPESRYDMKLNERLAPVFAVNDDVPGRSFRYANTNFMVLGRILEAVFGRSIDVIFRDEIFELLGMTQTFCGADTGAPLPGDILGYETTKTGDQVPAETNICWEGDAGIVSSLTDLLKWERVFHDESQSLGDFANRLTKPCTYTNGENAPYCLGVRVVKNGSGIEHIHQGGLRGWRMARLFRPADKLSVIVMFNHMTDPAAPARSIADALSGQRRRNVSGVKNRSQMTKTKTLFDDVSGLCAQISYDDDKLTIQCGGRFFDVLAEGGDCYAGTDNNSDLVSVDLKADCREALLQLPAENLLFSFNEPPQPTNRTTVLGAFRQADELAEAVLSKSDEGEYLIKFTGILGESETYTLNPVTGNIFTFQCERALDFAPPGEFTIQVNSNALRIGCWAAHNISFYRVNP
ncbi:MAG: serine hydrolase [Pseudomonadota bacterium]